MDSGNNSPDNLAPEIAEQMLNKTRRKKNNNQEHVLPFGKNKEQDRLTADEYVNTLLLETIHQILFIRFV